MFNNKANIIVSTLEKAVKYLGHKDIQSTKRYSHLDETTSDEGADILEERMFAKS